MASKNEMNQVIQIALEAKKNGLKDADISEKLKKIGYNEKLIKEVLQKAKKIEEEKKLWKEMKKKMGDIKGNELEILDMSELESLKEEELTEQERAPLQVSGKRAEQTIVPKKIEQSAVARVDSDDEAEHAKEQELASLLALKASLTSKPMKESEDEKKINQFRQKKAEQVKKVVPKKTEPIAVEEAPSEETAVEEKKEEEKEEPKTEPKTISIFSRKKSSAEPETVVGVKPQEQKAVVEKTAEPAEEKTAEKGRIWNAPSRTAEPSKVLAAAEQVSWDVKKAVEKLVPLAELGATEEELIELLLQSGFPDQDIKVILEKIYLKIKKKSRRKVPDAPSSKKGKSIGFAGFVNKLGDIITK